MNPHTTPPPRAPLTTLAAVAIIGQVVLLARALLLPLVSEYRLVGDNISELVLGRLGWVQTLAFIIAGIGKLALAYAIRQLSAGTWGSRGVRAGRDLQGGSRSRRAISHGAH